MPERTVNVGVMTYVAEGGLTQFALHGAVVDVAATDLARFDRLNGATAEKPARKEHPSKSTK